MGFMDEYNKALKEMVSTKAASTSGKAGVTKSSGGSTPNYIGVGHENFYSGNNSKGGKTFDAPIITTRVTGKKKKKKEDEERSWFKKGLFEDGYDFGDISRTILGSATDVLENVGSGIIGMGEKAVDAMAYIAPYAANAQFYQNGGGYNLELQKQHDKMVEQSKKELGKFIAKDLYDEQTVARTIISDPARMIGIDSESHSVFGEKSDALVQSGGQLLATAGLAAAGLPWWATMGTTSFGSEAENAMNQGATYEEAGASAAISAGAEILSEKLSGGISFGGKTLDDALTKQLARGISNKLGRNAAKLGLDMAGEGAEEIFSQVASNLGSSLYKEEDITELLFSEEAFDEYLESFIGGAVLGGVAGSYNAVKSNRSGVDYTSGLTESEQKVVDKLYQDEIASREKEGKVTQKEKSKIYDTILEDMEKGYISIDTIEEVLGGETYSAYKNIVDSEDAILKEYDELGEKPNATPKDYARYTELTEKVKDINKNSQRNAFRAKLDEDVMGLVNGSRLAESYNERTRTGQKFEADVTKYDAKQQAVVQKAIDSGILNNSNRTHEFVDFVSKISADTGVLFDFSNTAKIREAGFAVEGQTVDGYITKDGITVNIDSPKSRQFVVGHEITHALEGTELYDALRKSVFDYAKMKNQYGVRMESIQKRYKEGTDFEAELTADLVGEYIFSDTDFINNLSTQNRNVFQKVYDEIKYLCKVATAGSKEARELEKVKRAFEKAYREGGKTQGDTKHSLGYHAGDLGKAESYFQQGGGRSTGHFGTGTYFVGNKAAIEGYNKRNGKPAPVETVEFDNYNLYKVYDDEKGYKLHDYLHTIDGGFSQEYLNAAIDGKFRASELRSEAWKLAEKYETKEWNNELGFVSTTNFYEANIRAMTEVAEANNIEFRTYDEHLEYIGEDVKPGDEDYDLYQDEYYAYLKELLEEADEERNDGYSSFRNAHWELRWMFGQEKVNRALQAVLDHDAVMENADYDTMRVSDSRATVFMKALGYEGIDVRGTRLDNTTYGSVIYDLKGEDAKRKAEIGTARYSLSDSDGKQLTKEQQDYFKDSKMRDENGNLKVMYHGSQDAGFHVFDSEFSDDETSFFFVDRNDVAASYSGTTETYEAKTIRTVDDMNNFLAEIGYDHYEAVEKDGKFELLENNEHISTKDTARELYEIFCWYEGVGEGDANYKVYLNLKNPLEVDAKGRNWNKIESEFSQEIYDRYQTLTAEEKEALTDIAEWEDFGLFKEEIYKSPSAQDEVSQRLKSAYYKLLDENQDVDMYQLFDIASDNFTEESLRENAVQWLKTRDYAQRAKEQGYDGVIFKNIVDNGGYSNGSEGASTVAIAFDSNQIKSVANVKPTAEPDIRYSLSDSNGRELSKEQSEYFKDSKVRDENGSLKVVYHGTRNADFTVFKRNVNFFTDSKEMADSYSPNGEMYEGYLNIKKPFEIDARGEKWSKIPIDAATKKFLQEYGASVFKEGGVWRTTPADIASVIEEAVDNGDMDYDGIIIRNIDDTGSYYKGKDKHIATDYIVFNSNQFKNADNTKPTEDKDIRFSPSKPVEETKDLLAVHNLTSEQVLKSLELGGLPMPSIAVLKADSVHDEYGDVSLILPKESIDPKANRANKVYGGDAWTPVYPRIEYKPNAKVEKKISDKYYGLARRIGYDAVRPMYNYVTDLERQLNNASGEAGMLKSLYDDTDMMNLYLQDSGKGKIEPIEKETVTEISPEQAEMNQFFIDTLGDEVISNYPTPKGESVGLHRRQFVEQYGDEIRAAYKRFFMERYDFSETEADNAIDNTSKADLLHIVRDAYQYTQNKGVTVKTEVDRQATNEAIRNAAADGYKEWIDGLFKGVEEKTGIRNNQDYYTRSGNPRSWDALHWANTLENVVKVMKGQEETGTTSFSPYNSFASLAHKRYGSIAEIKADSNRLGKISEEEYEALGDSFASRFAGIAESIKDPAERNPFIATDNAAETIVEAVRTQKTKAGMLRYLQEWSNNRATKQTVDDIVSLVNDIANMPTGYFEAKPQRAVGFDEVAVFVIPYDADVKLKQELLNKGYSIAEYDPKVEGDRQRVVNQFEEYKFSLSNVGEQHTPDSLSALRLGTAEDSSAVAPVVENATTPTVSETESVRAMFPDDGVAEQEELENLIAEEAEIRGVMEAYAGVGDIEAVNVLIPEHEAIRERIKELQQHETDRADSLVDSDVPPEMDAPFSLETKNYDPFEGITEADISRSTRSYSDRNPGARIFLEEAALGFGYDVNNSTHGERWYNDELYYSSGGEKGFGGISRHTTSDIAELKDTYGYTWDELLKAADDVAKGDFRSVAAKRVEYLCHKRLMEGYTDVDGRRYEPNQDYISFLNETFANENRAGSFDNLLENADLYAPAEEIAPVKPTPAKLLKDVFAESQEAPIFEGRDGQTTMFEPEKKSAHTGGKTANVLTNEPKTPKRRSKFWSLVKEHVLDNGMVFEDLSKETGNRKIEAKWNFIRYSKSRAQRLIGEGADGVKALKDIKKEVDKTGKTGQFYDYLYHKHNVDRMSLEDRYDDVPNKAVFGDSVTSEMSQRKVNEYELANPEFMRWADDVYGYMNHLRGLLVENGVISQETADLWEEMYPHYVPIRRAGEDGLNINVPLDTYRTTVNTPVKRATGGNQDILPLFDTMAQRTIQTYKAIARNSFGIELKNTLGSVVDKNVETVDDVIDGIDTDDALLKPGEKGMNPTFTVFEDGERVEFEITEEMYEAMKPSSEALHYRNKILGTASSVFRGLTTQYSIPFMATNAIKDAQDVLINSQHPAKTYANFPRAWWQQATNGKWYQEYIENGGEDNTYFDTEENVFKEDSGLMKVVKFPLTAISTANNFIELTPRLSEYIASREAGRSIEVSMLDAARVTTNFAAGGDLTKFLNRNGATFLNASVQGAIQQARNIREAHHKGLMGYVGLATKFALAGLPTVLLNNMLWDDDEDYEELADYVKQDYYVIGKYGDGKFIRIPKGRTVAVIQNAIEQVQHIATGDGETDLGTFLTLAVNNLAPNNPLDNNILAPIMQVANNQTWYGEELVPSRLQDLPSAEQFDEKTDNFSKWLGEQLDISPYKVNYLLNQYSGGIGDVLLPMMTPRAENGDDSLIGNLTAPLRDKFTTDSVINSQVVSDFYDTKDALAVQANSSKATEEDFFRDLYMDTVGYELSDLYKQKREIQNSDLPNSEKYEKSRELQEQIVEGMKNALDSYNNVHSSGVYAEVGDKRYNQDADSGKWYEIKPKNADGSDNWYYQKEQEVTKGLGISYEEYWNNREEYNYAYDKPGKYAIAQAVGGYDSYMEHYDVLENWQSDSYLSADKDSEGNSISGSRKEKVIDYINGLDADYGEKIILYRTVYSSKSDKEAYNQDIIDYLNGRDDISYTDMEMILKELDFEVDSEGNITW